MFRRICVVLAAVAACTRGDPPAPAGVDAAVAALPPPPSAPVSAAPPRAPPPFAGGGADPGGLAQTRDRPKGAGEPFDTPAAALWDAIVHDDPDRAMPFFFPVGA